MIPDLASVMRKRYRMERNIRFLAVLLFSLWIVVAGFGIVETLTEVLRGYDTVSSVLWTINSTPFLAGSVFLGLSSARIARWILPLPRSGCPRCGYRLVALVEPRCPECGLGLPRELMHDSDNAR